MDFLLTVDSPTERESSQPVASRIWGFSTKRRSEVCGRSLAETLDV
jgi:hypothetical protein